MEPAATSEPSATSSAKLRYEKLERAYLNLLSELDGLEREGKLLRGQAQAVIDKEKMKTVLENILAK